MSFEWYIGLVQWDHLISNSEDKYCNDGSAWDYVFMRAACREGAIAAISGAPCTIKGFKRGPKTKVMIHKIELLDDAMEDKDITIQPRRRRIKRAN